MSKISHWILSTLFPTQGKTEHVSIKLPKYPFYSLPVHTPKSSQSIHFFMFSNQSYLHYSSRHRRSTDNRFNPKIVKWFWSSVCYSGRITNVKFPYRASRNSLYEDSTVSCLNINVWETSFTSFFHLVPG